MLRTAQQFSIISLSAELGKDYWSIRAWDFSLVVSRVGYQNTENGGL